MERRNLWSEGRHYREPVASVARLMRDQVPSILLPTPLREWSFGKKCGLVLSGHHVCPIHIEQVVRAAKDGI